MLANLITRYLPRLKKSESILRSGTDYTLFFISLFAFGIAVWDTGFPQLEKTQQILDFFYKVYFAGNGLLYIGRYLLLLRHRQFSLVAITNLLLGAVLLFEYSLSLILGKPYILGSFFHLSSVYKTLTALLFIFELSRLDFFRFFARLNPPQIFIFSFGSIILTGALFLMMPQATTHHIYFVDAVFTATSAVCVTGLTVVDTATGFTMMGKAIILALIQIGGLGIMTFTSFFAVFFKGTQTFREKQILQEWLNDPSLASIRHTLSKVVLFMLLAECAGIILIYLSLDPQHFEKAQGFRFAVFHAISAFCNAGFSTYTDNLFDHRVRDNIAVLYIISSLIVIGGIGFPVVLNLYDLVKAKLRNYYEKRIKRFRYVPAFGLLNINTRLVLITTFILIIGGAASFFIFEYNHTLQEMPLSLKIAHSFMGSITPRTAGFNAVNMSLLSSPAILLTMALMWIGASPVSTGGGIKTTTFAVALLNLSKIIKGKERIEIFKRAIDPNAVSRAFAIMFFSFIILAAGTFSIYVIEPHISMLKIAFECFSAYGTVGLSLGITPLLTPESKMILVLLMFFGRMGTITLLMVFVSYPKSRPYRYPSDTIVIT
jgi:trk system potassium uptake protein